MSQPARQKPLPPERDVVLIRSASLQLGVCRSNEAWARSHATGGKARRRTSEEPRRKHVA